MATSIRFYRELSVPVVWHPSEMPMSYAISPIVPSVTTEIDNSHVFMYILAQMLKRFSVFPVFLKNTRITER